MKTRRRFTVLIMLVAGLLFPRSSCYAQARINMNRQTIIAERSGKASIRMLLAVDVDDVVHEIGIGLPGAKGSPEVEGNLGTRVTTSGKLILEKALPKDRVATVARRVTLDNGVVIHFVVAWGFPRNLKILTPYASLYAVREEHGDFHQLFEEELGTELDQFIVEDINSDGKIEILATTRENEVEVMLVWQILSNGDVTEVQRIEGYSLHAPTGRYLGEDETVILAETKDVPRAGSVCYKVDEYTWSPKQGKFVKRH